MKNFEEFLFFLENFDKNFPFSKILIKIINILKILVNPIINEHKKLQIKNEKNNIYRNLEKNLLNTIEENSILRRNIETMKKILIKKEFEINNYEIEKNENTKKLLIDLSKQNDLLKNNKNLLSEKLKKTNFEKKLKSIKNINSLNTINSKISIKSEKNNCQSIKEEKIEEDDDYNELEENEKHFVIDKNDKISNKLSSESLKVEKFNNNRLELCLKNVINNESNQILSFNDEFMSKYDEFSDSWKKAAKNDHQMI